MVISNNYWNTPTRNIKARVELFDGSTLINAYTEKNALKSFDIERIGENKFFGFGVCQKINLQLVDRERVINISAEDSLKAFLSAGGDYISSFPLFKVEEVKRDENTNEITVTGYDALYAASTYTIAEVGLTAPYTLYDVTEALASFLGLDGFSTSDADAFGLEFADGANFDGTETLREVLNAIAEATQTIYYIDNSKKLIFKRLDAANAALLTIDKANYFTLESKMPHTLTKIVSATELGDNVGAGTDNGEVQYVRDNPFWELRDDVGSLVDAAIGKMSGLEIQQFNCSWRGNPQIELGDKISLVTKDDAIITSFLLNDTISFSGGLSQVTSWEYKDTGETASNPSTLGDALKKTFARVDKANKEIELVAGETAEIKLTTDAIQGSVVAIDNNVAGLAKEVNTKMSAEDVSVIIQQSLDDGIEKVTTSTGYTFNEQGLTISKSDSEITTTITEDGMTIAKNNTEVLAANNQGVYAEDLHATTFLIIGKNSRLEDYGSSRTGCFWIGG